MIPPRWSDKYQYGLVLPRTVAYILGDPYRNKAFIHRKPCQPPTDRNAVNTAFTKIDHPYRKTYSVVSRKVWHTLCLDLQSSFFWPFSNSITEKVQPSICHFGLVNTSKATRVIFSFFSTLKTWKSKFVSKSVVNKIYLKAEHNHLLFPRWSFSWKVWSPPTKEVTLAEVPIPSPLGEMLVRLIWPHCHFQDWQLAYLYGSFQLM